MAEPGAGYDVRRGPGRSGLSFVWHVYRDLFGALTALDAVGGDLVCVPSPQAPRLVLARHPDLVREVLVDLNDRLTKARGLRLARAILGDGLLTSEAPAHTARRRLVLPAFHHQKLRAYAASMTAAVHDETSTWAPGVPLDAADAMGRVALSIAGRTLFSADVLGEADRVGRALTDTLRAFERTQFPLADRLMWLPTPAQRRSARARATLDALVYRLIASRRAAPPDAAPPDDLLGMLLDARDAETGAALSDLEVRDEVMTLLLAGHETTAVALSWTLALLAQSPDAEAALHAEVDALGEPPSFDTLDRLPVARATLAEAMRMRPPAWTVGREVAREVTLAGVRLRPGTTILFSPLGLGRDPRWWDAPAAFRPERFLDGAGPSHKFAYVPFSAGRRGCIGERFAWTEGTLALATLARDWRLTLSGSVPPPRGSVTLRLGAPLQMTPHRRRVRHRGVTP